MSVFILPSGAGRLACFHHSVRKSESWGADANHQEGDERNAIRNPTAARLCQWLERTGKDFQERISIFSVDYATQRIRDVRLILNAGE